MSSRDYIPARDNDLQVWSANFSDVITANPTFYGLSAGQAAAYATLDTAYAAALAAALNPATRTPVTVAAKDTARNSLVASARQLGQVARKYPGITDDLLSTAGLTVPDPVPSPIPSPTSRPVLSLMLATALQISLRYKDSILVNPRSRPPGVVGMELYWTDSATPTSDPATYKYFGLVTRMPGVIDFASSEGNKTITFLGRWITAKGLRGPISDQFAVTCPA